MLPAESTTIPCAMSAPVPPARFNQTSVPSELLRHKDIEETGTSNSYSIYCHRAAEEAGDINTSRVVESYAISHVPRRSARVLRPDNRAVGVILGDEPIIVAMTRESDGIESYSRVNAICLIAPTT